MSIFKKIDQIKARFGNIKAMERLHVDTFTENKIKNVKGFKIAEGTNGQLFAAYQELAGYQFLNLSIITNFSINTGKGAKLTLHLNDGTTHEIPSDTQEIESDYSNVSRTHLSYIDFLIEEKEIQILTSKNIKRISLLCKKKTTEFPSIFHYEEEE